MKKCIFLLFAFSILFAGEASVGIPVSVELVSGAKSNAEYMGESNDTIFFGGFVADTFAVAKILKSRISALRDSNGDALSYGQADSLLRERRIESDSAKTDRPDSPSTAGDSSAGAKDSTRATRPDSAKAPKNLIGKSLLFPAMHRPIDSALAARIRDLAFQTLREEGESPILVSTDDFPGCKDSPCIVKAAEDGGAAFIWTMEIQPAAHQDSLDIDMHRYSVAQKSYGTERQTVSAKNATGEMLSENRFLNWMRKLRGTYKPPEAPKPTRSAIYVETDPEGATVAHKGEFTICQTPCTFAVADTGKFELEAFWSVENTLWANKATIRPIPGDTAKVHLKLKRVRPEVEIKTFPPGAKIFESAEISPRSRPIGKTPKKLFPGEPGELEVHLWKEGFRDTTVKFQSFATERAVVEVKLDSIRTAEEFELQREFIAIERKLFWGRVAMGVAIAPAVAGGILLYLSEKDREKARDLKNSLSMPSSGSGENFNRLVDDNHKYADRAKTERYAGIGLLILSGGILSTGFILYF